jgi:hypothetical protein
MTTGAIERPLAVAGRQAPARQVERALGVA